MTDIATPELILTFWRDAGPPKWFSKDDAFDADLRGRFLATYEAAAAEALSSWEDNAAGALALVIILDQFPQRAGHVVRAIDPQGLLRRHHVARHLQHPPRGLTLCEYTS